MRQSVKPHVFRLRKQKSFARKLRSNSNNGRSERATFRSVAAPAERTFFSPKNVCSAERRSVYSSRRRRKTSCAPRCVMLVTIGCGASTPCARKPKSRFCLWRRVARLTTSQFTPEQISGLSRPRAPKRGPTADLRAVGLGRKADRRRPRRDLRFSRKGLPAGRVA